MLICFITVLIERHFHMKMQFFFETILLKMLQKIHITLSSMADFQLIYTFLGFNKVKCKGIGNKNEIKIKKMIKRGDDKM